jgi:hypothetical protein
MKFSIKWFDYPVIWHIIWWSVIVLCENVYKTFTHKSNKTDSNHWVNPYDNDLFWILSPTNLLPTVGYLETGNDNKSPPNGKETVYNENSIFSEETAPLILLWLFPEAYHCVVRNEFYKTMPCLISPRPPRRDHTSLHSPLHSLFPCISRKVTNFCIKPQLFGFKQKVTTLRQK